MKATSPRSALYVCAAGSLIALIGLTLPGAAPESSVSAAETKGDPMRILPAPGRRGAPMELPRGDVLLFAFLKEFAGHSGEVIYLAGNIPPDESIRLERAFKTLEVQEVQAILAESGFEMTRESYPRLAKDKVLWVRRPLDRRRRKGALVRRAPGDTGEDTTRPRGERSPGPGLPASGIPSLRLYQRADGGERSYLIQFETTSRTEASDVLSLIEAALQARRPAPAAPGAPR